jgi:hypothetical protein
VLDVGDGFLVWDNDHTYHLAIIIKDCDDDYVLAYTVSTPQRWKPNICVLTKDDHRWLKKGSSVIMYSQGLLISRPELRRRAKGREVQFIREELNPAADGVVQRIIDGMEQSEDISSVHEEFMRGHCKHY